MWTLQAQPGASAITSALGGKTLTNKPLVSYTGGKLNLQNTSTLTYSWVAYNADMLFPATYWVRWRRTGTRTDVSGGIQDVICRRNDGVNGSVPRWECYTSTNSTDSSLTFNFVDASTNAANLAISSNASAGGWHTSVFSFNTATKTLAMVHDGSYAEVLFSSYTGNQASADELILGTAWISTDSPSSFNRRFVGDISGFGYIPGVAHSTNGLLDIWSRIEAGSIPNP